MRTYATIICLILVMAYGTGPVAAAEPSPSPLAAPVATPSPRPGANPICAQAFSLATVSVAASPAADASPTPEPAIDRLDAAIRACSSLEDWVIGSLMYPDAVRSADALALLTERCTDPSTGLDAYATCRSLAVAMATPAPVPSPTPEPSRAPEPTPSPTARPTPDPRAPRPSTNKPGPDGLVRLPRKLSVNVPGASDVRYFKISGRSASTLVKQTLKRAKRRCGVHNALACVDLSWRVQTTPTGESGACTISSVTWALTSTVHLPRWSKPGRVDPALLRWWRKVLKQSAKHEARHIKIQRFELGKLDDRLVGKPCSSFNTVLKRVQKKSSKAQTAFDRRERTRPLPPAP